MAPSGDPTSSAATPFRELRRTYLLTARKLRRNIDYSRSSWNAYAAGSNIFRRVARDLRGR